MAIPNICRGHAQKVVDLANEKIRKMRDTHRSNMMDAERHIGLLHNSMERVVNAKNPQTHSKALNSMKDMFTSTVRGQSSKTGQFVDPSSAAGEFYGQQKRSNMRSLSKQVKELVASKLKKGKK